MKLVLITLFAFLMASNTLAQENTVPTARYEIQVTENSHGKLKTQTAILELKLIKTVSGVKTFSEQLFYTDKKIINEPIYFSENNPQNSIVFKNKFAAITTDLKAHLNACYIDLRFVGDDHSISLIQLKNTDKEIVTCVVDGTYPTKLTIADFAFGLYESEFINPNNPMDTVKIKLIQYAE